MSRQILILTEPDLRAALSLDLASVEIVEQAFVALASGTVIMPPIMSMEIPEAHAEVDIKTACIPGFEGFAVKISTGFFNNPQLGLPSLNGLMVVFNAQTGVVDAVLLDNGFLTDLRTAAAGALAAKYLAPETVTTAGVLGTGVQARLQIEAAHLVRPFKRVLVWGRNGDQAAKCARDIADRLNIDARPEPEPATLLAQCQLVITTTPATTPILSADWLHPGLHITAMGSDQEEKNELDPAILASADLYVCDRVSQCEQLGELRAARAAGLATNTTPPELGEIINGTHTGRLTPEAITVCDLTGTGAQDTAIATAAIKAALAAGAGVRIDA